MQRIFAIVVALSLPSASLAQMKASLPARPLLSSIPSAIACPALNPPAVLFAAPALFVSPAVQSAVPAAAALTAAPRPVQAATAAAERPNPLGQLRRVRADWLKSGLTAPEDGLGTIAAYVLDLDGNAFGPGFPTKIILFKKGGGEELPVSAAQFAVIERDIGKDVVYGGANLKDYELRGEESFRNFSGPKFAADIKDAVENLPASEWQGPSWAAMARALSDPRTARSVYVLTARRHTPEQMIDGFRYLQVAGYIKHLPRAENLHGVGGSAHTAARKAEMMAKILDGLQAAPFGEDGGPHAAGFSDDTWANYETVRDALTGIMSRKPGRWGRVKIALFFTGANDPEHAPAAIALNADGTTRPYVPGEPR